MNRRTFWMLALGLAVLAPASSSFAQERQNRGGGGFDMAQFQEMRLNRTKERLAASEEEWQVLKPKIEKVWTAQAAANPMSGMFGGRGRGGDGGGDRGGNDNRQRSAAETAARELRDTLENKEAAADQIAAKLAALREARAKAKGELESAQKDLKEVLTPRQEAVMVSLGTLDYGSRRKAEGRGQVRPTAVLIRPSAFCPAGPPRSIALSRVAWACTHARGQSPGDRIRSP